jgi:hypothetical protein
VPASRANSPFGDRARVVAIEVDEHDGSRPVQRAQRKRPSELVDDRNVARVGRRARARRGGAGKCQHRGGCHHARQ